MKVRFFYPEGATRFEAECVSVPARGDYIGGEAGTMTVVDHVSYLAERRGPVLHLIPHVIVRDPTPAEDHLLRHLLPPA